MYVRIVERTARDTLGEGPVWDARRNELLWVDIMGPCVHRLSLETGELRTLVVDEPIGWVLPRQDAANHVAGFSSGFHFLDIETGARRLIGVPEADRPQNRLNDAKVDSKGRIWAGSKDDRDEVASGALYRLDATLTWARHDDGYGVANGPTFSPDGRTLYHTDSAARSVFAFSLAEDGRLTNKRLWLRFEDDWGYPDGMTTDSEGFLWIAHWGGGRVSRFSPEAELVGHVALPTTNITSCAFAGQEMQRLFVTSSTLGCADEAYAGAMFEIEVGVAGLPTPCFAG